MPSQARHAAGLVLARRSYRAIAGGPVAWLKTRDHRPSQRPAGGWSGHFVLDSFPDTIFDITQWVDRDEEPVVVGYSYQVRYCNNLRDGVRWQYRLDHHPLEDERISVPHYHDQPARDDEHEPHPSGSYLALAEALPLLEQHLAARTGPCSGPVPGLRGRAPHEPGRGAVIIES